MDALTPDEETEVLAYGQPPVDVSRTLENGGDGLVRLLRVPHGVDTVYRDAALSRYDQPQNTLDRRRLARTVRSENPHDFTAVYGEADIVDRS
jgi:hypothetical protein